MLQFQSVEACTQAACSLRNVENMAVGQEDLRDLLCLEAKLAAYPELVAEGLSTIKGLLVRCKRQGKYSWQQVWGAELLPTGAWLLRIYQGSQGMVATLPLPYVASKKIIDSEAKRSAELAELSSRWPSMLSSTIQVAEAHWRLESSLGANGLVRKILAKEGRAPDGSLPVSPKALDALLANLRSRKGVEARLALVQPADVTPLGPPLWGQGPHPWQTYGLLEQGPWAPQAAVVGHALEAPRPYPAVQRSWAADQAVHPAAAVHVPQAPAPRDPRLRDRPPPAAVPAVTVGAGSWALCPHSIPPAAADSSVQSRPAPTVQPQPAILHTAQLGAAAGEALQVDGRVQDASPGEGHRGSSPWDVSSSQQAAVPWDGLRAERDTGVERTASDVHGGQASASVRPAGGVGKEAGAVETPPLQCRPTPLPPLPPELIASPPPPFPPSPNNLSSPAMRENGGAAVRGGGGQDRWVESQIGAGAGAKERASTDAEEGMNSGAAGAAGSTGQEAPLGLLAWGAMAPGVGHGGGEGNHPMVAIDIVGPSAGAPGAVAAAAAEQVLRRRQLKEVESAAAGGQAAETGLPCAPLSPPSTTPCGAAAAAHAEGIPCTEERVRGRTRWGPAVSSKGDRRSGRSGGTQDAQGKGSGGLEGSKAGLGKVGHPGCLNPGTVQIIPEERKGEEDTPKRRRVLQGLQQQRHIETSGGRQERGATGEPAGAGLRGFPRLDGTPHTCSLQPAVRREDPLGLATNQRRCGRIERMLSTIEHVCRPQPATGPLSGAELGRPAGPSGGEGAAGDTSAGGSWGCLRVGTTGDAAVQDSGDSGRAYPRAGRRTPLLSGGSRERRWSSSNEGHHIRGNGSGSVDSITERHSGRSRSRSRRGMGSTRRGESPARRSGEYLGAGMTAGGMQGCSTLPSPPVSRDSTKRAASPEPSKISDDGSSSSSKGRHSSSPSSQGRHSISPSRLDAQVSEASGSPTQDCQEEGGSSLTASSGADQGGAGAAESPSRRSSSPGRRSRDLSGRISSPGRRSRDLSRRISSPGRQSRDLSRRGSSPGRRCRSPRHHPRSRSRGRGSSEGRRGRGRQHFWDPVLELETELVRSLGRSSSSRVCDIQSSCSSRHREDVAPGGVRAFMQQRPHLFRVSGCERTVSAVAGSAAFLRYKQDIMDYLAGHPPRTRVRTLRSRVPPPHDMSRAMRKEALVDLGRFLEEHLQDCVWVDGAGYAELRTLPPRWSDRRPDNWRPKHRCIHVSRPGGCWHGAHCWFAHAPVRTR